MALGGGFLSFLPALRQALIMQKAMPQNQTPVQTIGSMLGGRRMVRPTQTRSPVSPTMQQQLPMDYRQWNAQHGPRTFTADSSGIGRSMYEEYLKGFNLSPEMRTRLDQRNQVHFGGKPSPASQPSATNSIRMPGGAAPEAYRNQPVTSGSNQTPTGSIRLPGGAAPIAYQNQPVTSGSGQPIQAAVPQQNPKPNPVGTNIGSWLQPDVQAYQQPTAELAVMPPGWRDNQQPNYTPYAGGLTGLASLYGQQQQMQQQPQYPSLGAGWNALTPEQQAQASIPRPQQQYVGEGLLAGQQQPQWSFGNLGGSANKSPFGSWGFK